MASGQQDSIYAKKYPTACWRFTWNSYSVGMGVSQVDWNVKTIGRYSSPTLLGTCMKIDISTSDGQSFNIINFQTATTSFKDYDRGSGNFRITHNNNGDASFTVYTSGYVYEYDNAGGGTHRPTQGTFSLDKNYSGAVWIYSGDWKRAIPYVYSGGTWHQAIPYVYSNGGWHICG